VLCSDFALACSELRMRLYKIQPLDRIEAIRLLGNSIPAVSTSTAAAAGLACVHFLRLIRHRDALVRGSSLSCEQQDLLRSLFCSISVSLETLQPSCFDALPAPMQRIGQSSWSLWDLWFLDNNPRVGHLWQFLKSRGIRKEALASVGVFYFWGSLLRLI
jgi:hypothetical protein